MTAATGPAVRFALPAELSATAPPESRGLPRDGVRLLVAAPRGLRHARFRDLPDLLRAGDLLVVNTSATLPAAVSAERADGTAVVVHFSSPDRRGAWLVEPRLPGGPLSDPVAGERLTLAGGATLVLGSPYPRPGGRLWRARLGADEPVEGYLGRYGAPIRYGYVPGRWPLSAYQTVYATHPGSAEMPSAGRPFTAATITRLVAAGVVVVPLVLHTGVSSLEAPEPPYPERYAVPAATARLVELTRSAGGRVVAVGTTVVRALETAVGGDGRVRPAAGWTDLILDPGQNARVVTGLLTGLHAPAASHLSLLTAVAGAALVQAAYDAAVEQRYLWHEFGDSCLFLP